MIKRYFVLTLTLSLNSIYAMQNSKVDNKNIEAAKIENSKSVKSKNSGLDIGYNFYADPTKAYEPLSSEFCMQAELEYQLQKSKSE